MIAALLLAVAQAAAPTPAAPAASALPDTATRVALDTSAGRIVVAVDTAHAPITARNFLRYVDARRFDGTRFYRVAKVQENFGFVQFGISAMPGRAFPPIRHEPTSQTGLKHLSGTLSMARLKPGSATADITISVGDQPSFDAGSGSPPDNLGYAAFGRVVEGMDVITRILDAPIDPKKLENGAFRGEVPVAPVVIRTARRLLPRP